MRSGARWRLCRGRGPRRPEGRPTKRRGGCGSGLYVSVVVLRSRVRRRGGETWVGIWRREESAAQTAEDISHATSVDEETRGRRCLTADVWHAPLPGSRSMNATVPEVYPRPKRSSCWQGGSPEPPTASPTTTRHSTRLASRGLAQNHRNFSPTGRRRGARPRGATATPRSPAPVATPAP